MHNFSIPSASNVNSCPLTMRHSCFRSFYTYIHYLRALYSLSRDGSTTNHHRRPTYIVEMMYSASRSDKHTHMITTDQPYTTRICSESSNARARNEAIIMLNNRLFYIFRPQYVWQLLLYFSCCCWNLNKIFRVIYLVATLYIIYCVCVSLFGYRSRRA